MSYMTKELLERDMNRTCQNLFPNRGFSDEDNERVFGEFYNMMVPNHEVELMEVGFLFYKREGALRIIGATRNGTIGEEQTIEFDRLLKFIQDAQDLTVGVFS